MILSNMFNELKLIRLALEKIANIESFPKEEAPKDVKFEMLNNEENLEDKLEQQFNAGEKAGYMFPEDAVDLDLLEEV